MKTITNRTELKEALKRLEKTDADIAGPLKTHAATGEELKRWANKMTRVSYTTLDMPLVFQALGLTYITESDLAEGRKLLGAYQRAEETLTPLIKQRDALRDDLQAEINKASQLMAAHWLARHKELFDKITGLLLPFCDSRDNAIEATHVCTAPRELYSKYCGYGYAQINRETLCDPAARLVKELAEIEN